VALELADVFRQYGPAYRQKYASRMPATHFKVMRAVEQCRTQALGGQVYRCPNCDQLQYSYHSCRNRHCPKCQNENGQHWLDKQQDVLLPVPYFLLTFTLPAGFNEVARSHQRLLYDLLFKTSAAATQQLAQEPRWLGGQIGMIGVLHTWGRNLAYHPHIHYLVPAGALTAKEQEWVPARHNFLLPVRALSKVFRGKLQQALRPTACYARIPANVWQQEWVVHCEGVGSGLSALKYLAPYIFRVAISNNRILKLEGDRLTFRYRATETGAEKRCSLDAEEFIHRFLQHVLPKGFVKVRYYGFFAATRRSRLVSLQHRLRHQSTVSIPSPEIQPETDQTPARTKLLCPQCGQPMLFQRILSPTLCHSP
jgi:putative transposase/transposase-like zinc-binding protein